MKENNIVIVGAGPAGCTTSFFLSKNNIPHTLIDQASFPRDKICGDALSGKTVSVLKKMNLDFVEQLNLNVNEVLPSYGCTFYAPNGKSLEVPFKTKNDQNHPPGFISKRIVFDNFLASKIDKRVNFIQSAKVTALQKIGDKFIIEYVKNKQQYTIENIQIVIGADGERSIVKKDLALQIKNRNHFAAGIRAYFENVEGFQAQNFIELHFIKEVLPGYLWVFPLPNNQANVGLGMLSSIVSKKKINLNKTLDYALNNNPNLKERFKNAKRLSLIQGWGLPLGTNKSNLSGEGFLLTGDAGSLIDPFTGEGIGNAMFSGILAAEVIKNAIKQNNFSANVLKQFDQLFYQHQWAELKVSTVLLRLCKYPSLFNFVVNKASKNKELQDTISSMFINVDLRAKLKNPLFYFKLLFS